MINWDQYITEESGELGAFKQRVRKVAETYTRRHGWCDEVERALKELGIEKPARIHTMVKLATGAGGTTEVNYIADPAAFAGLSEEKQIEKLAKELGPLRISIAVGGQWNTETNVAVTAEMIEEWKEREIPGVGTAPAGYHWMYTSADGRKLHLVPIVNPDQGYVYSSCGQYLYPRAMTANSPRGDGSQCSRCVKRAEVL